MTRTTITGVDLATLQRLLAPRVVDWGLSKLTVTVEKLSIEQRRNGVAFKADEGMWTSPLGTVEAGQVPMTEPSVRAALTPALARIYAQHLYSVDQSADPCYNVTPYQGETWSECTERVAKHVADVVTEALQEAGR